MQNARCCIVALALLPLLSGNAIAARQISYSKLYSVPVEDVPAKVHVTDLFTTHGNAAADGFVYILDQTPKNWEYIGKGKISVSDRYSRAGAKSIRWDWKAGDVIRIKDAGIISKVRVGFTGFHAKSEEIAPFALSIFQNQPLPKNTVLALYFKRTTDHPSGNNEVKLTQMRYFMNFTGTWYRMGGVALNADANVFGQGNYINVIDQMPSDVAEPEFDEILLQAPTNVASGTFYLDRLITLAEVPNQRTMDARAKTDYLNLHFTSNGKLTDNRAWPFDLSVEADMATIGIIDKPIDPTTFNQANTGYYGYNARKPDVPETLT